MNKNKISDKIKEEIAAICSIADKLPGVVIIHDLQALSVVWMSRRGLEGLGITAEEMEGMSAEEYFRRYFNEEDAKDYVPKILGLMLRNNDEEVITVFQQVRFGDNTWHWHMSSIRIWARDEEGKPWLSISIALPMDAMHHIAAKAARLVEENNFLRKNFSSYAKLSKREREVLRLLALGKSATDTAEELFISLNTVETHRKNIKQKLDTTAYFDLCQYARAFDLV
jgi:DNA-binding CsgD family transcriptional regulator